MDEHKVSAVGVVDDKGRLVGNLSASDLKVRKEKEKGKEKGGTDGKRQKKIERRRDC